jgi:SAM-dependent methyltransferase
MVTDHEWVQSQTNRALKSNLEVGQAEVMAMARGWPFHPERTKNWDNFLAVYHAIRAERGPVLDAGACRDPKSASVFLPTLALHDFTDLHGINLDEGAPVSVGGATYQYGDITSIPFPDQHFAFIACLSTIEHGVDWRAFYASCARVLRRGGELFVSFDYWKDPVDTGGQMAFGAPVKVFTKDEVLDMVNFCASQGLRITSPTKLHCKDRVIQWLGMNYTFCNLHFRRD